MSIMSWMHLKNILHFTLWCYVPVPKSDQNKQGEWKVFTVAASPWVCPWRRSWLGWRVCSSSGGRGSLRRCPRCRGGCPRPRPRCWPPCCSACCSPCSGSPSPGSGLKQQCGVCMYYYYYYYYLIPATLGITEWAVYDTTQHTLQGPGPGDGLNIKLLITYYDLWRPQPHITSQCT